MPITADAGFMLKLRRLMPVPVRDLTERAFALDRVATDVRDAERAAYERRIAGEARERSAA